MSKAIIMAGWDDVPHLSEEQKKQRLESTPPHLRDSRSKGIPSLGSGAIYAIPPDEIKVDPFPLPPFFRRCFGLDVGWNFTAAVWLAHDMDRDIVYVYDVYKKEKAEPDYHINAIRRRDPGQNKIPGVIDPAARTRSQTDGRQLLQIYRKGGLAIREADNAVEAGIEAVYDRLSSGRMKVFRDLTPFFDEYILYRRDEKGRIVKENDHIMDAWRYAVLSGLQMAKPMRNTLHSGGAGRKYF